MPLLEGFLIDIAEIELVLSAGSPDYIESIYDFPVIVLYYLDGVYYYIGVICLIGIFPVKNLLDGFLSAKAEKSGVDTIYSGNTF